MRLCLAAAFGLIVASLTCPCLAEQAVKPAYHGATKQDMRWWEAARFGMFIHWGPYSQLGVEASWPLFSGQVPRAKYEAQAKTFNPTKFDPMAIARLAKAAGQKYVIITAKHHDGFAMYDTKLSDYSIMHTPYGRDVCRMLEKACRAEGLRFGFYFSLADWHDPDYMTAPRTDAAGPGLLPQMLDPARWERFVDFMHGQVRELMTNYGRIDVLWFDGGWEHTPQQWKALQLHQMIRRLQPHIIINDRGTGGYGDYSTPEQTIPAGGLGHPWETCMTINNTWAYNPKDRNFKSVDDLLTCLARTSSGGGNFLLDIGPEPTGEVQPEFVQRLRAMGKWLAVNGASVYGTTAGPRGVSPGNFATMKGRRLYVHLIAKPRLQRLALNVGENRPLRAFLLSTGQPLDLRLRYLDNKAFVDLSEVKGDLKHQVVAVDFAGPWQYTPIQPNPDGSVTLAARDVTAHGTQVCYQSSYDDIGCWTKPADWVSWAFATKRAGDYEVILDQGAPPGEGGIYTLSVDGRTTRAKVKLTKGWTDYHDVTVARVRLKPGKHVLAIKPVSLTHFALMNIKRVRMVPVGAGK